VQFLQPTQNGYIRTEWESLSLKEKPKLNFIKVKLLFLKFMQGMWAEFTQREKLTLSFIPNHQPSYILATILLRCPSTVRRFNLWSSQISPLRPKRKNDAITPINILYCLLLNFAISFKIKIVSLIDKFFNY